MTIGNFDGVHAGHKTLLRRLKEKALQHKTHAVVLLFDPHPHLVLKKISHPFLLTTMATRLLLLEKVGVDFVALLPFNSTYASMTPQTFIQHILKNMLATKQIVIGDHFSFGTKRSGDVQTLEKAGISVDVLPLVLSGKKTLSSTRIRHSLKKGALRETSRLLGRFWETEGLVIPGRQRGRKIGFPTINIPYPETLCPPNGVYAGRIEDFPQGSSSPKWRTNAVINLGKRPTFEPDSPPLIEAHCLPVPKGVTSFYGSHVRIAFLEHLREQRTFRDRKHIAECIRQDIQKARHVHQTFPLPPLEEDLTMGVL